MRWNTQRTVGLATLSLILVIGYLGLEAVKKSNIEFLNIRGGLKPEAFVILKAGFTEGSMLTREVVVSPRGWDVVELCRTSIVPGEVKRTYDFTGHYETTDVARLLRRGNSCR